MTDKKLDYVYCDNRSEGCSSAAILINDSYDRLRARGWRIWSGKSQSGIEYNVTLCPACVGQHAKSKPPERLPGDQPLPLFPDPTA